MNTQNTQNSTNNQNGVSIMNSQNIQNMLNIRISLEDQIDKIVEYSDNNESFENTELLQNVNVIELTNNSKDFKLVLDSELFDKLKYIMNNSYSSYNSNYSNKWYITINSESYELYLSNDFHEYLENYISLFY